MLAAMQSFTKLVGRHAEQDTTDVSSAAASEEDGCTINDPAAGDTYLLRQFRERNINAESKHNIRIVNVLPFVRECTVDLRHACSDGLSAAKALLDSINERRYSRHGAKESEQHMKNLDAAIERLQQALVSFKQDKRLGILKPFEGLFQSAKQNNQGPLPLRALYVAYVFAANLIVLAQAIEQYMLYIQGIAVKRRKNRLWAPGGLRAIVKALKSKGDAGQVVGEDYEPPVEKELEKEEAPYSECLMDPRGKPLVLLSTFWRTGPG
jgi:hypothetical protein